MFAYPEPIVVLTAGTLTDPYSQLQTLDWSQPTEAGELCAVAPGGSTEPTEAGRAAVDSDFDLIFDHEPAVTAVDRVRVRGLLCDVDGHPVRWRSPFTGWEAGWVVHASIREG